jgi:lysophospholipase L1-like esterase
MKLRITLFFLVLFSFKFSGIAQDSSAPFFNDILEFKESDRLSPPPKGAILFVGSSSFRMWSNVGDHFPGFTIINRGFGGSTLVDQIRYVEDIIFPYEPKQIVVYCGENDLAASDTITSEMVVQRFIKLFNLIRATLPNVPISYVSMKPSPSRWHLSNKFIEGNKGIQLFIESMPNASYISVWDAMMGCDSTPNKDLFLDDMLHLNEKGYTLWQKIIAPNLLQLK